MNNRTVKKVIASQIVNMGGHLLDQPLPAPGIDQIDPFLLIHHWDHPVAKGTRPQEAGVGPHPHRGFSPVTFVFKGSVHHRDSIGNDAVVAAGGTQWMHSGSGIVHSERPGKKLAATGGENEFIQFWVNTPAQHKMETPYYLPISDEETPRVTKGKASVQVIAGDFEGTQGPAKTYSPQTLLRIESPADESFSLAIPKNFNALLYVLNGRLEVDGQTAKDKDMLWFNNDGEQVEMTVREDCRCILLSGAPIAEAVYAYGPFVMNSEAEIQQALFDYQNGKMGQLKEQFD